MYSANTPQPLITPRRLQPGDAVGITSPAGYMPPEAMQAMVRELEAWGLQVRMGNCIGQRDGTFGGTDEARLADFQQLLDDPGISAILCARGGYGFVRIIDRLDFSRLRAQPKWMVGFSDITVLHSHVHQHLGVATLHAPMASAYAEGTAEQEVLRLAAVQSIRQALMGDPLRYSVAPNAANRPGSASGVLVGGNLRTLETLTGSQSSLQTDGKILFLEDTNEALYSIDRMFWHLQRSGRLAGLAGLVVGGFDLKPQSEGSLPFSLDICDIVNEKVASFGYPVCFDFPVGHQVNNFALKCGLPHRLEVGAESCSLAEA